MKRIQRKRTKGWRMPENVVYVGRPGKLGNPFTLNGDYIRFETNTPMFPRYVLAKSIWRKTKAEKHIMLVECYRAWIFGDKNFFSVDYIAPPPTIEKIRQFINGRDVACWCSLDKQCHADVLLEICNAN